MRRLSLSVPFIASVLAAVACGDDGPADVPGPRPALEVDSAPTGGRAGAAGLAGAAGGAVEAAGAAGSESSAGSAGNPTTGGAGGAGGSEPVGGAGTSGAGTSGASGAPSSEAPPADAAAVNAFLQTRAYRQWPAESVDHPSKGPHGGTVKTFLNPTLDASFAAGNATHPAGSISVKEFYQNGKPSGFAYSAKLDADSAGGDGWYWYEVFTDAPANTAPYAGKGLSLCKNCHAGGSDFVLIGYPLQ